jgi:GMP synthase (glutamine-hydrolysing)
MKTIDDISILIVQFRERPGQRARERTLYAAVCAIPEERLRFHDVHEGPLTLGMLDGVDAVILGGSGYSVWDDIPTKDGLSALVREADRRGVPMLGVCFGAQFLASEFGGKVEADDANKEVGTYWIRRTEDGSIDAMFADMPDKFRAQCAHHCRITELPPGAVVLAKSDVCPVHAFTLPGRDVYAVQFHPEITKAAFIDRIERDVAKGGAMPHEHVVCYAAVDPYDVEESPQAFSLIRRFIERIVLHRARTVA